VTALALADRPEQGPRFSGVDIDTALLYGVAPWQTSPVARLSPREALSVPAVKFARDKIAGAVGSLPLALYKSDGTLQDWSLLNQPEETTTPVNTWTDVAEDLLFESVAWLRIINVGWHNKPVTVKRLDPRTVTVQQNQVFVPTKNGHFGQALEWIPDDQLIRIDSPNAPLLVVGARAIRTLINLSNTTDQAASALPPSTYFTPAEGVDPFEDETEIQTALDAFALARSRNVTGYVPAALKLNALGWNPEQLQLKDLREQAVLEIARLTGVDAEDLGVSTTSRTYFNAFDRKQAFIQFTLGPYLLAISQRLSMDDVTPRGYAVRHDLDAFFQADTLARYQAYQVGLQTGAITHEEIRANEGKPPLTTEQMTAIPAPTPTAAPSPQEVPAHG
jgi:HK97 family phage portal protein